MSALLTVARAIDWANGWIGRAFAWLILAAVIISAGNATIRKAFNISSNAWLEAQWYLFGAVFMLCAAWTLRENEHVRIDVISGMLAPRTRVWIDLVCHILFLIPFVAVMLWLSVPFFWKSFSSGEQSMNAGGLIIWPAKSFVLLGFISLAFQAIAEIIKRVANLTGHLAMPDYGNEKEEIEEEAEELRRQQRGEGRAETAR